MVRRALPSDDVTLEIKRRYDSPAAVVFRAWTDSAQIQKWLRPNKEIIAQLVEVDLCVGGKFRIGYKVPDSGELNIIAGQYHEVVPNRRLVFSWTWEIHPEFPQEETLVTVELAEEAGQTELTLTHQRFPTKSMRDTHRWGWNGASELLVEHCRNVCRSLADGTRPM